MPRDFAPPNNPPGRCTRLAAVRLLAKCVHMFPLVSDYPQVCFRLDLLLQLLLMLPLLSRSAHGHAVRLPPSATHGEGTHDYTAIAGLQLLLYFPASAAMVVQPPSLQHQRWVAMIDPHRTPLLPRARGWSSSQPAHREQGPVSISSPMKLHRSLLSSCGVFESPMQSALTWAVHG